MVDKNVEITQDEIDKFLWELRKKYSIRDKVMVWILLKQVTKYHFRDILDKDKMEEKGSV